jgi:hypothetical protein
MRMIATIGLDIAKSVFQVHGIDAEGKVVLRRQLKRRYVLAFFEKPPPCVIGIEACASAHHWSRELQVLGHTVRLMPPAYVFVPYTPASEASNIGSLGPRDGASAASATISGAFEFNSLNLGVRASIVTHAPRWGEGQEP